MRLHYKILSLFIIIFTIIIIIKKEQTINSIFLYIKQLIILLFVFSLFDRHNTENI